jgi:1,4-dihydroxy-2-naphthoate octaprenyltransferase
MPELRELVSGESALGLLSFGVAALIPITYVITGEWPAELGGWGIPLFVLIGVVLLADDLRGSVVRRLPIGR